MLTVRPVRRRPRKGARTVGFIALAVGLDLFEDRAGAVLHCRDHDLHPFPAGADAPRRSLPSMVTGALRCGPAHSPMATSCRNGFTISSSQQRILAIIGPGVPKSRVTNAIGESWDAIGALPWPQVRRQRRGRGGCKHIVGARLKQEGMRWTVEGANAIIALRCAVESNRLDDFWEQRAAAAS